MHTSPFFPRRVLKGESCVGDKGLIKVGSNTNLQDGVLVRSVKASPGSKSQGSTIGDNVTVGHGAVLNGVTIEDEAFIGIGAILQQGVKVACLALDLDFALKFLHSNGHYPNGSQSLPQIRILRKPACIHEGWSTNKLEAYAFSPCCNTSLLSLKVWNL